MWYLQNRRKRRLGVKKRVIMLLVSYLLALMTVMLSCESSTVDDLTEPTISSEEEAVTGEETPAVESPTEEPITTTDEQVPVKEVVTETTEIQPTVEEEPTETEDQEEEDQLPGEDQEVTMTLTSTAFQEGETIPDHYTCDGQDRSPELHWIGVPEGTRSFVLILDDPDAPGGTFNHWVIFNIPADATGLEEGLPKIAQLESGAIQLRNSFRIAGYGGPCPPPGPAHNYTFTLYALDTTIDLTSSATKAEVLGAIENHVLAQAELTAVRQY
jgi:Raf kinase inhibitor-like YbhB/YbcL family protein